jgi:hypothetical protein
MSMTICVLANSQLSSISEWQKAIDAERFPLQLSDADPTRNLAARLRDEETSIEYGIYDFGELKDTYKHVNFGRDWKYVVAFTWSSDFAEGIASWMATTAYARATEGIIFDEQEGRLFTPAESLEIACDMERDRPELEAALQRYVEQLSAKSPEAEAALRTFMQRRSTKSSQA